jgi:hypothetical protein
MCLPDVEAQVVPEYELNLRPGAFVLVPNLLHLRRQVGNKRPFMPHVIREQVEDSAPPVFLLGVALTRRRGLGCREQSAIYVIGSHALAQQRARAVTPSVMNIAVVDNGKRSVDVNAGAVRLRCGRGGVGVPVQCCYGLEPEVRL